MKGTMLLLVLCAAFIGPLAIPDQPAMAVSFGMDHVYGIGASTFQGTNHTWNWNWRPWGGYDKKPKAPKTRSVPVPGTLLLFGAGLAGFAVWRKYQRK